MRNNGIQGWLYILWRSKGRGRAVASEPIASPPSSPDENGRVRQAEPNHGGTVSQDLGKEGKLCLACQTVLSACLPHCAFVQLQAEAAGRWREESGFGCLTLSAHAPLALQHPA